MKRRSFLAIFGSSALGGCSGIGNTPTPRVETKTVTKTILVKQTETQTESPTQTNTPSPTPMGEIYPGIYTVSLISDWQEFGDVTDNAIDSIPPDEPATIGVHFLVNCGDEREVRWRNVTTIRDSTGDAVASETAENEEFSTSCDDYAQVEWEQALTLWHKDEYGSEWPLGTYTAEVRIDDFYAGESVSGQTEFEVVAPDDS